MRLAATAAVAAATLAAVPAARADLPCPCPAPAIAPPPSEPVDGKSETTAVLLSLGGTAAGVGLLALADTNAVHDEAAWDTVALTGLATLTLGPSLGQWYAGRGFTPGLGMRLGGLALATIGLFGVLNSCGFDSDGTACTNSDTDGVLLVAGGLLFVGGGVWDIVSAPRAVHDWNAAHAGDVTILPTALRGARGDTAPGFALTVRF